MGDKVTIAIVGSRTFGEYKNLVEMDEFISSHIDVSKITKVVSGAAAGADTLGRVWAQAHGIIIKEYPADWKRYGKAAGHIRNVSIIDDADIVFAFWDGKSTGTKHSISLAKEKSKELHIYTF